MPKTAEKAARPRRETHTGKGSWPKCPRLPETQPAKVERGHVDRITLTAGGEPESGETRHGTDGAETGTAPIPDSAASRQDAAKRAQPEPPAE